MSILQTIKLLVAKAQDLSATVDSFGDTKASLPATEACRLVLTTHPSIRSEAEAIVEPVRKYAYSLDVHEHAEKFFEVSLQREKQNADRKAREWRRWYSSWPRSQATST